MKTISCRFGLAIWGGLVLGLLCWTSSARGATFSPISPASINNTYTDLITLQVGGLTDGETVVIDKYLDANTNGVIDEGDWLVQSFRLTDGQVSGFGGVTNINVPYDSDSTPGSIISTVNFLAAGIEQKIVGTYLFRLSSPTARFPAVTNTFSITNTPYAQGFAGKVKCNGTNIPYAGVLVFSGSSAKGGPVAGTVADGSGNYTIKLPPDNYQLWAFKSNYVFDMGTAPQLALGENATVTTNLHLIQATRSISGRYDDLDNPSLGIPGFLVSAASSNNRFAIGFTDANGNFVLPVTAGVWGLDSDGDALPFYGYLNFRNNGTSADTTSGNASATNAYPKGTALFYGSVKDSQDHPLPGVWVRAGNDGSPYEGGGYTDSNGNYSVTIVPGDWNVGLNYSGSESFFSVFTNIVIDQAVRVDFNGFAGAAVSGCVLGNGTPLRGVNVQVGTITTNQDGGWKWQQSYSGNSTDSNGNYSVTLPPGTNYYAQVNLPDGSPWLRQFYSNAMDYSSATVISVLTNAPATNINFNLQPGAIVSGQVLGNGVPLGGLWVQVGTIATNEGGGWNWQQSYSGNSTDSNGNYSVTVPPGANYYVQVNLPNGSPWLQQFYSNATDYSSATMVSVLTNAPATNINFNLQPGAIVSGQVLGNSTPLMGVNVQVGTITTNQGGGWKWQQSYSGNSTDSNGNYSVTLPPGTNYYAQVNLPDGSLWLQQFYSNAMDYSSATAISVLTNAPATNINFNLQPGAIVSGQVLGNGVPLKGVWVQVGTIATNEGGGWNWQQSYGGNSTDSSGNYSVTLPPGTDYYAQVNLPNGSTWVRQFYSNATDYSSATVISVLTNAPATNINFNLILGMTIEGCVMDASNNPVSTGIELGLWDGTNWVGLWGGGSDNNGDYSCTVGATSNFLIRITDGRFHEVYYSNKLSADSASVLSGSPGTVFSNMNFKLYDPSSDSDHDGLPDYIEGYVTGTDPFSSNDCLRCIGVQSSNGLVTLTWASVSGKLYGIERSTNLLSGSAWTNLVPLPVMSVGSKTSFTDSNMPACSSYRVFISY